MRKVFLSLVLSFICLPSMVLSGEKPFSWTSAPPRGSYIGANLSVYSLGKYLAESQVNRPEIVAEVKDQLSGGEYYRKRTKDQKGKSTELTVYLNNEYTLYIKTYRNETCPTCGGTGTRAKPFDKFSANIEARFRCLDCDGEGEIKDFAVEKFYIISAEDFENPELGRQIMSERAFAGAPEGAEVWVNRLASQNPRERLAACLWLDENYVRTGKTFHDVMPMIKKARFQDQDKKTMVWQFWAGRGIPEEGRRAYYRIYADTKTGKITKKGFYAGR